MRWSVRAGNVRSISVTWCDEDGLCSVVIFKEDGTAHTRWRLRSKTLADVTRSPQVPVADLWQVLYDALPAGRRAWLTRWAGMYPGGYGNG